MRSFALPIQSRSLALMLGRSEQEATEWISWGTHVFRDFEDTPEGHARDLDRYLERAIDEAIAQRDQPGRGGPRRHEFFGLLATATFRARPLTRDEMMGFANLTFAGGRDTVINSITNSLFHLATNTQAFDRLRNEPSIMATAVEEFLRYYSPLTHIGRVVAEEVELGGKVLQSDEVVSLCFASANRDEEVFERADECLLDRKPNRHVAFGYGPHACLGARHARMVLSTVLGCLIERVARLEVIEAKEKLEDLRSVTRQVGFDPLLLELVE